ncbi:MAG: P-II family nitrogen regulator [Wenzhouxiangella sp.]
MTYKLILAFVEPDRTEDLLATARGAGASGATVITNARGEGRKPRRGVFGLEIAAQRDVMLLVVEPSRARKVMDALNKAGDFENSPGTGVVIQLDVEDALGVRDQMKAVLGLHGEDQDEA